MNAMLLFRVVHRISIRDHEEQFTIGLFAQAANTTGHDPSSVSAVLLYRPGDYETTREAQGSPSSTVEGALSSLLIVVAAALATHKDSLVEESEDGQVKLAGGSIEKRLLGS